MNRDEGIPKTAIIYAVAVPLSLMLGYMVAQPLSIKSLAVLCGTLGLLILPLFLKWHHTLLVLVWNAAITPYFLPGQPEAWMLMVLASLPLTVLARCLDRNRRLDMPPTLVVPLLMLLVVIGCTIYASGGVGLNVAGSAKVGGKRYINIVLAVLGFFAISWVPVPASRRRWITIMFFAMGATSLVSELAYAMGPNFYFLYNFFSVGMASYQIQNDMSQSSNAFLRLGGVSVAAAAIMFAMIAKWGLRGILDLVRPWRMALFGVVFIIGLMGGFRSLVVISVLVVSIQFFLEKLHKTRHLFVVMGGLLLGGIALLPFLNRLPIAVQRAVSIIPGLPVDQLALADARYSSDWRLEMWQALMPEVPRHLWVGKGYTLNLTDVHLAQVGALRGIVPGYESSLLSGDYHNGILTLIIPLGIWGMLAFLAFLAGGTRALYLNYRHGEPDLQTLNTFLLAFFLGKAA